MNLSKIGIIIVIFGIVIAIMGTFFYQNALIGVLSQTAQGNFVLGQFAINLQITGEMTIGGVILTIIGAGLIVSNK